MTKFFTAAALIVALSTGATVTTATSADAFPYSLNGGSNAGPFGAGNKISPGHLFRAHNFHMSNIEKAVAPS